MPRPQKLVRCCDLLLALLSRRRPATFDELAGDVAEYAAVLEEIKAHVGSAKHTTKWESLKRTFERDKDELKAAGIPLESTTVPNPDGSTGSVYRVDPTRFYLPYLFLQEHGETTRRPRAAQAVQVTADVLQAIVEAAATVCALGDPLLRDEVRTALHKLSVNLPVEPAAPGTQVVPPRRSTDPEVHVLVAEALRARKQLTFTYVTPYATAPTTRTVEPYGLFFLHGYWYLAAHDTGRAALRKFRLDRMEQVDMNRAREQSPDYRIPADFNVAEYGVPVQPWELGHRSVTPVLVDIVGSSGPALAAASLGTPVDGQPGTYQYDVRELETFLLWVLSLAPELRVRAHGAVHDRWVALAAAVQAPYLVPPPLHAHAAGDPPAVAAPAPPVRSPRAWEPKGAAAQLTRLLTITARFGDGRPHRTADIAATLGVNEKTIIADLVALRDRVVEPAGFVGSLQLYIEADTVELRSTQLERPMRLTHQEFSALDLGLRLWERDRGPDGLDVVQRATTLLQQLTSVKPRGAASSPAAFVDARHAAIDDERFREHTVTLRTALTQRRMVEIGSRKSGDSQLSHREVRPYAMLAISGMMYLVAWCEQAQSIRVFRTDRIQSATLRDGTFELPVDFNVEDHVADGRLYVGPTPESLVVCFRGQAARVIAEQSGGTCAPDGTLIQRYPLADRSWAQRHVLQFGTEAEVLAPASMRDELRNTLHAILDAPRPSDPPLHFRS
jgi:predicted DNA-binding transcriptional regulator YafY